MKTYCNHRDEPYFTFLKNGQKTIEGRAKNGKYEAIKVGDAICVYDKDETDSILTRVERVTTYKSIKEMLKSEGIKKMLPDVDNIEQGFAIYRKFYSQEQESKFGMVAIEVEVIG
jgi:ASC-1-like (ASCH) protein